MPAAFALAAVALAAPLSPGEAARLALAHDPRVARAAAAVEAAAGERREVATFLANPEAQVGWSVVGDLTFVQAQQPVSLAGEGWHARRSAAAWLAEGEAGARRAALVVAADARATWARAAAAERRAVFTDEAAALAGELRATAERRASVGEGTEVEVALARAREAVAVAAALDARAARTAALVSLAALGAADAEVRGRPGEAVPPATGAAGERADVRAAEAGVERWRAALARARAGGLPALGVGVQFQRDGGTTDLGPQVTVAAPLWNRNGGAVGEALGALAAAEAEAEATRAAATAERARTAEDQDVATAWASRVAGAEDAALAGLRAVAAAVAGGELGVRDAAVLQGELLDGRLAAIEVELRAAEAGLAALLAVEDPALLP
jgi:outer membrane protein TolC